MAKSYRLPKEGWLPTLKNVIRYGRRGEMIVVESERQKVLVQNVLKRRSRFKRFMVVVNPTMPEEDEDDENTSSRVPS